MTHQSVPQHEAGQADSACVFCRREFARSDALRRHWTTCKTRIDCGLDVPTVPGKTRGRKLRSCDRCSRLKQACNFTKPCLSCNRGKHVCTYNRHKRLSGIRGHGCLDDNEIGSKASPSLSLIPSRSPSTAIGSVDDRTAEEARELSIESFGSINSTDLIMDYDGWNLFAEYTLAATILCRPTSINIDMLIRFPFLEKFTKSGGFVQSFECGSREGRSSVIALAGWTRSTKALLPGQYDSNVVPSWIDLTTDSLAPDYEVVAENEEYSALLPKTQEIVAAIRGIVVAKSHRSAISITWSPSFEARCYEFYHPSSIQKFLALFWNCWYPNCPTIHQPTFDPTQRSLKLIAAMVILGACLSSNTEDQCLARTWFDVVEQLVFTDDLFNEDDPSVAWGAHGSQSLQEAQLDILQAAYCVCLYQNWEGCKKSRKRVLRHRFNTLLHLSRDINFENASLQTVSLVNLAVFSWDDYILRESLIRICTYICNIDSAFALFYRHPPRMVLSEMIVEMSSPEICFRASTADECFVALRTWRKECNAIPRPLTIATAIEALYDPATGMCLASQQAFANMSVLNMFSIINVLYAQVFNFETSLACASRAADPLPIETALRQWKESWPSSHRDAELAELEDEGAFLLQGCSRIGFTRHAPEYWLLTHLILQRILGSSTNNRRLGIGGDDEQVKMEIRNKCASNEMTQTHALVSRFQCLDPATVA